MERSEDHYIRRKENREEKTQLFPTHSNSLPSTVIVYLKAF
jgi:hypothetical protein